MTEIHNANMRSNLQNQKRNKGFKMIKYMDKILIGCMMGAAAMAVYLSFSQNLLYAG
jgi:hypothetical protein